MGRTCGEPDEIELTAMGVKLNGSRCRPEWRQLMWAGMGTAVFQQITGVEAAVYYTPEVLIRAGLTNIDDVFITTIGTRREPFNSTPMGVNPISPGSPHVRPMGRTCGA